MVFAQLGTYRLMEHRGGINWRLPVFSTRCCIRMAVTPRRSVNSPSSFLQDDIMPKHLPVHPSELSLMSDPAFWPMAMAAQLADPGEGLLARNCKFVEEEIKNETYC